MPTRSLNRTTTESLRLKKPSGRHRAIRLVLERLVDVPRAKAFDAFARSAELSRWFTTKARGDARVGGTYVNGDGDRGTWLEVERPSRLVFTWENPKHCPNTLVTVTFTNGGLGMTVVRLRQSGLRSAPERDEMRAGWSWALDSLRSYLETGEPIAHEEWLRAQRARAR